MKTLILNGWVCDGTGREPEQKDLLVENGRITEIAMPGSFDNTGADRKINAAGKAVAPGFIDVHSHDDIRKLRFPQCKSKLLQGITTVVDGNCGSGATCVPGEVSNYQWQNLEEYAQIVNDLKLPVNTVALAGHNSIRRKVMGNSPEKASADEINAMQKLLENAFAAGAAGWTSGLTYFPGKFADETELKALSQVTLGTKKIYATHMRSEGDDLINAVEEAVNVAKAGSNRLQISHLKTIFPRNYHKIDQLLALIAEHQKTTEIHADRYPYIYSSTRIGQILPAPYDKITDISQRLQDSVQYREEITTALKNSPRELATTILIAKNKTLADIAAEKGSPIEKTAMEILMENAEQTAAYLCMSEDNLKRILALPYVCPGTDGISCQLDDPAGEGHPRAIGTFPKFYHIVSQMCTIGETIRKMTGLPATIYRIPDRGFIRKNHIADLVIFDKDTLDSHAGFSRADMMPVGIDKVLVNGAVAWDAAEPEKINGHGRFIRVN